MITREADYGLRAILFLSSKWPDGFPIAANVLAEEMQIPYRFLRRIVTKLADAGFVISERGRNGGIHLAKSPDSINLLDILENIDPKSVLLNSCIGPGATACQRQPLCSVHREMTALQSEIEQKMSEIKFSKLA